MGNVVRASIKLSFSRGGVSNIGVTGLPGFYPFPPPLITSSHPFPGPGRHQDAIKTRCSLPPLTPLCFFSRYVGIQTVDHPSPSPSPFILERAMTRFSIDLHPTPLLYKSTSCRCSRFDTFQLPRPSPRTRTRLSTSNLGPIEFSYASSPSSFFFSLSPLLFLFFFFFRLDSIRHQDFSAQSWIQG